MRVNLQLHARNIPAIIFWIAWLSIPYGMVILIDPSMVYRKLCLGNQEVAWRRLVLMFACSTQLSIAVLLKLLKKEYPLNAEVEIMIGSKCCRFRAGTDLQPLHRRPKKIQALEQKENDDLDSRLRVWADKTG